MGKNSKIEWTHHTFNPWWGCVKVSPACKHCYAESWAKRVGVGVWGISAPRRFFSETHWRQPHVWNAEAKKKGVRRRVFCASMADIFEERDELVQWRQRLWQLIENTPSLDWLLLTKRPENIVSQVPWKLVWPNNVWLGTTAENQKWADERIPLILQYPARVRFVSCEPLLGRLDLSAWLSKNTPEHSLNWIIAGGESGPKARPTHPDWLRHLRDQCATASVPFHFKQWGNWTPTKKSSTNASITVKNVRDGQSNTIMMRTTKVDAGRKLDGETWDGLPERIVTPRIDADVSTISAV